jgi:hypothetical protein
MLLLYSYTRKRRGVDERGFTDRHLLTLEMLHPRQVWVDIFPQNRERLTGADFEWWIGDGSTYLPMLVQAKRLDPSGNYAGLDKRLGKTRSLQITRLIQVCTAGRSAQGGHDYVGHLPAYLFYNTFTPTGLPVDRCCGHLSQDPDRGCTIAHAIDVNRRRLSSPKRGSRSIQRIGPKARPWGCLFCCPEEEAANTAQRAKTLLEGPDDGKGRWIRSRPRTVDQLPSYVHPAFEVDFKPQQIRDRDTQELPGAAVVAVTTISRIHNERRVESWPTD